MNSNVLVENTLLDNAMLPLSLMAEAYTKRERLLPQ
jgi:hypothetical protein